MYSPELITCNISVHARNATCRVCHFKIVCAGNVIEAYIIFCRKANKISDDRIKPVLLKIAVLLQMLNDYQDLYVDSKLLGKDGTDIQQRKCTWFAANFLEKAFPEKRESFKRIYGSEGVMHI